MILSTLAFAFTLISQAISLSEGPYWIGDSYSLSWSKTLASKTVDIVLYYGDNLSSNWTILKNAQNTGVQNITVGGDLSNSVGQLMIENGTMGQFRAEIPTLNQTNGTRIANLSHVVPIYQTVMFQMPGRALRSAVHFDMENVTVYVRRETYLNVLINPTFVASFVSVNEDGMTWSVNDTLGANAGPTSAPTPMPTTATPTTATPTTATPTTATPTTATPTTATPTTATPTTATPTTATPTTATPTTATPTTATPTTATPTTATPTTATPTTATPTTATPTTATPTTATPTTATPTTATPTTATPTTATPTTATPTTATPTTATPTTATPTTATPTTATPTTPTPTTPGLLHRRLLGDVVSLRDVTLGLENDNDDSVSLQLGGCKDRPELTWCAFEITVSVPTTTKTGGPYLLNIGVMDQDSNDSVQYYGINDNEMLGATYTQFLLYNMSEIHVSLDLGKKADNQSFYKYEEIPMSVTLGDSLKDVQVYVGLQALPDFTNYYLECGAYTPDYYTAFGWKTWNDVSENVTLPQGVYQLAIFWAGYAESFYLTSVVYADYYKLEASLLEYTIRDMVNDTHAPAVTIKEFKYSKGRNNVELTTSFNEGTLLTGYIEQCNYSRPLISQCRKYGNSTFNVTYKSSGTTVKIDFPDTLYDTKSSNNLTETFLYVSTLLCDGETSLTTQISLEIGKSSGSNSSTLSAGAIVGIVCAGVLVLGLAAWWLCMKKGGGDGYRELNE